MLTITVSARAVLLAALITLAAAAALYATDAFGSDPPDSILQGDTDCDGDVDAQDALNDLRYAGGLDVGPFGGCPEIGTEAAIPGPQGDPGPQGPPGVSGYQIIEKTIDTPGGSSGLSFITECPQGKTVIGGGASADAPVDLISSYPFSETEWFVAYHDDNIVPAGVKLSAHVICATVEG